MILLVAFTAVNLILAYSIWGPWGILSGFTGTPYQQQVQQVKNTLTERGFDLAAVVPPTPGPMRFLRVEYKPTLEIPQHEGEPSTKSSLDLGKAQTGEATQPQPTVDRATQAVVYRLFAQGPAARDLRLDNRVQVLQEVQNYLQSQQFLPPDAQLTGIYLQGDTGRAIVEFVPVFDNRPVFSGFIRVEASTRGIETVSKLWVEPKAYKEAPAKVVRPAAEALLRLAGHLERTGEVRRVITDIRLGYYAGRSLTAMQVGVINGWDTVPVWRITLDGGQTFFINGFNGEFES